MALTIISVFLSTALLVYGLVTEPPNKYTAAVVEYEPLEWDGFQSPKSILSHNANRYVKIIEEAAKENVDIIVFPEGGLTTLTMPTQREKMEPYLTFIPEAEHGVIPCDDKEMEIAEHLRLLSCAAKTAEMYVVVNMDEKKRCTSGLDGCPSDRLLYYNTNIVFDRAGLIIAKYRKYNLFMEPEINRTALPQYTTFKTDFGVTFGMFICYDILFLEPAETLVSKYKVTDVVYSTAWFSELPMLTAVQTQAGYSYTMNVNLLASGYNRPEFCNAGSGIYGGMAGPIVMIMPEERTTKLLIGKVPIKGRPVDPEEEDCEHTETCRARNGKVVDIDFDDSPFPTPTPSAAAGLKSLAFFKEDLSEFTTKPLRDADSFEDSLVRPMGDEKHTSFDYESGGFTCTIKTKWTSQTEGGPFYRLVGYAGMRTYATKIKQYIEVCGVIACADEKLASCGLRPKFADARARTNIMAIDVSTVSKQITTPFVMTLDEHILPLMGSELSFVESIDKYRGNLQKVYMFLEKPRDNLISFGVYKQ